MVVCDLQEKMSAGLTHLGIGRRSERCRCRRFGGDSHFLHITCLSSLLCFVLCFAIYISEDDGRA
jgi:hypothetical protein